MDFEKSDIVITKKGIFYNNNFILLRNINFGSVILKDDEGNVDFNRN